MYIFKNALRNIVRSKGRNILIGIIVLAIATSSCVALSIKQAAATARDEALSGIKITAQISVDRQKIMKNASDRSKMAEAMQNAQNLSISDMQKYAACESVEDFYYTLTTAMNKSGKLEPVDTTGIEKSDDSSDSSSSSSSASSGAASTKPTSALNTDAVTVAAMGTSAQPSGRLATTDSSEPQIESETESAASENADSNSSGSAPASSSPENASSSSASSAPSKGPDGNAPDQFENGGRQNQGGYSGSVSGSVPNQNGGDFSGRVGPNGDSDAGSAGSGAANGVPFNMDDAAGANRDKFMAGVMGMQGDFTIVGYSSLSAMSDFSNGTKTITDGEIFDASSKDKTCVISSELASYNNLKVRKTIKLQNPNSEKETIKLKIVGIYTDSESGSTGSEQLGGFSTAQDSANQIYMSYPALKKITNASIKNEKVETEQDTGRTSSTALREQENGTYVFADVKSYEKFESQARALGLSDDYTISSTDVSGFENKIAPLENLGNFATYFLIIVLAIGAVILAVLNIFNIRERKYEIGVLAAIGMKKRKISLQFLTEIFIVTFISIIIGTGIGASVSVPVTNALLQNQITASESSEDSQNKNFGRSDSVSPDSNGFSQAPFGKTTNYISSVTSAANFKVVLQLMLVGVLLTLAAGCVAIISVLRYDPLKILTMRD